MESKEFIEQALKTEYVPEALPITEESLTRAMEMAITCADIMDQIKKLIIYGKPINLVRLRNSQEHLVSFSQEFVRGVSDSDTAMSVPVTNDSINIRLLHAAIGIFTESGEMLSALLSQLEGEEFDVVNVAEEIGDVDWYKAIAIDEISIPEKTIRQVLINKLAKRY